MRLSRRVAAGTRRIELFKPHVKPAEHVTSCLGCGWQLQSTKPRELGFQPPPKPLPPILDPLDVKAEEREAEASERCLCQRCWRIRNNRDIVIEAPDQTTKLRTLKDRVGVVVLIADLADIEGSLPSHFARDVSGANPVILVGNKKDLIPAGATDYRLRTWLARRAEERSLYPTSVHVVSSKVGDGVMDLVKDVADRSNMFKKDVFLCGRTNVGKSSLLNKMIRIYRGPVHLKTTVSPLHGTTVGLIPVPLGHNGERSLYDTPGLLGSDRIHSVLSKPDQKIVTPTVAMKPIVYRLIPGKCLVLGDVARLDYVEGTGHLLFTTFVSSRLANLIKPTTTDKAVVARLEPVEFVFDGDDAEHSWNHAWTDIAFPGVGWVSVTGRAPGGKIKLVAHGLKGVMAPVAREPLMPIEAAATELKKQERPIVKHGSVTRFQSRFEKQQQRKD